MVATKKRTEAFVRDQRPYGYETTALRLVVRQQGGWASGVHEWRGFKDGD